MFLAKSWFSLAKKCEKDLKIQFFKLIVSLLLLNYPNVHFCFQKLKLFNSKVGFMLAERIVGSESPWSQNLAAHILLTDNHIVAARDQNCNETQKCSLRADFSKTLSFQLQKLLILQSFKVSVHPAHLLEPRL